MRLLLCLVLVLLASAVRAAEPDGLYLMTRFWPSSGLEIKGWLFRNGQVSSEPKGDIARFDFAAAAAGSPDTTGRYAQQGDELTVTWANGKSTKAKIQPGSGRCFNWNGGLFCPAAAFADGTRLDGTFTGGASVGGGRVGSARTLQLTASGRYQLDSAGAINEAMVAGGSSGRESGSYEIAGTRLSLKPEGGTARQVLVFPYDDGTSGPQPRRLFFDGGMLKRME